MCPTLPGGLGSEELLWGSSGCPFLWGVRRWGRARRASPSSWDQPGSRSIPTGAQPVRDPKSLCAPHLGRTPDPKGH